MAKITALRSEFVDQHRLTAKDSEQLLCIVNGALINASNVEKALQVSEHDARFIRLQLKEKILGEKSDVSLRHFPRVAMARILDEGCDIEILSDELDRVDSICSSHKGLLRAVAKGLNSEHIKEFFDSESENSIKSRISQIKTRLGAENSNQAALIMRAADVMAEIEGPAVKVQLVDALEV